MSSRRKGTSINSFLMRKWPPSVLEDALALVPSAPAVSAVTAGPSSSRGPSTSSEAKLRNLLQQGIKLVDERQKLIKMADRSNFGWGLVSEYLTDELAENSEDERWIHKAEKAAGKKQNETLKEESGEREAGD